MLVADAMWTRYMLSRKIIDDIINRGVIGSVTSLTANIGYELSSVKRIWDTHLAGGALLDVGCYLVNFARMICGENITNIQADAIFKNGVDAIDSISLEFDTGKMATMQCSVVAALNRRGTIFGTKGYIEIQNINNPELIEVYDESYHKIATHDVPGQITGFEYEVEACMDAIAHNDCECAALPHSETLAVMTVMDKIRSSWGYALFDIE